MTKEELEQAKKNIRRADEILGQLNDLNDANPYGGCVICKMYNLNTNAPLLSEHLLHKVIANGRIALIEQLEDELAAITPLSKVAGK